MKKLLLTLLLGVLVLIKTVQAEEALVTLIVDDLGNNPDTGLAALKLPGELTYAILPNTPYATLLAELANEKNRPVMLHLPMQSEHHEKLGPNGLRESMPEEEFKQNIISALDAVPFVTGLNNHMGSLLTQKQIPMQWLMTVLKEKNLFFLDSRTTTKTIAESMAESMGIPAFRRDVFIDNDRQEQAMLGQLDELVARARLKGFAIGIAHPYPETIAMLEKQIPLLQQKNVKLVSISSLMEKIPTLKQQENRSLSWQPSLSRSPRVVKNSKP